MQKVYLLLRSNKQTGPYTLEEILQLNLKPFDLVWVEGRSAAWQYPSEIPALEPFVDETPQSIPFQPIATAAMEKQATPVSHPALSKTELHRKVFVSIPKSYQPVKEQSPVSKTEEVKQELPSYNQPASVKQQPAEKEIPKTNYSRSLNEVEEDYTHWMYKQKTKNKLPVNARDAVFGVLILAIVAGGFYVMSEPSVTNAVMPASNRAQQNAQPQVISNTSDEVSGETPKEEIPQQQTFSAPPVEEHKENTNIKNPAIVSGRKQRSVSVPVNQPTSHEKTIPVSNGTGIQKEEPVVMNKEPEVIEQTNKESRQPEKKKKFGEMIKGIFTKKDKKEEPQNNEVVLEEPRSAGNRRSQRRSGDESKETKEPLDNSSDENSTNALAGQIELSSNAGDNWMLGVRNLKITLRNRSNVTIQTASVQVNYYDENNRLLEKKLVYFSNVLPKGKATVAAPDNKFADHANYKLVTASAKDDRYASYQ